MSKRMSNVLLRKRANSLDPDKPPHQDLHGINKAMATIQSLPSFCQLKLHPDENGVGLWLPFKDWIDFLKENFVSGDKYKTIHYNNTLKEFRREKGGVAIREGNVVWASFSAILRYCFHKKEVLQICKTITDEVEACLLRDTTNDCGNNTFAEKDKNRNADPDSVRKEDTDKSNTDRQSENEAEDYEVISDDDDSCVVVNVDYNYVLTDIAEKENVVPEEQTSAKVKPVRQQHNDSAEVWKSKCEYINKCSEKELKDNGDKSDAYVNVENMEPDTEETTKTKVSLNCSICNIKRKISRVYTMCQQWVCGTCAEELKSSDIGQQVSPGKTTVCLDFENKPKTDFEIADSSPPDLVVKVERSLTSDHDEHKTTDDSAVACVKEIVQKNVEKLKEKCVYLDNMINSLKLKVRYIEQRKYEIFGEIRRKIDMSVSVIDQCVQSLNFIQSECVAKTDELSSKQREIDPFVVKLKKCIESTELVLKSWNDTSIQLMKQKDISQVNNFLETEIVIDHGLFDFSVEYKNESAWCTNSLEIGTITINNKSFPHLHKSVAKTSEGSETFGELPLIYCENSTCSACNLRLFIDDSPSAVDVMDNPTMSVDVIHKSIVSVDKTDNLEMPRKSQSPCSVNHKVHGDKENILNKTFDLILRQALSSAHGSDEYAKKKPEISDSEMTRDCIPAHSHKQQKKNHAETTLTSANVSAKPAEKKMESIQSNMTSDCVLLNSHSQLNKQRCDTALSSEKDTIQNVSRNSELVHPHGHTPVNTERAETAPIRANTSAQDETSYCIRVNNETYFNKSQFETALRPANTSAQNVLLNNKQAVPVNQSSKCGAVLNSEQITQQTKANKQPVGNKQPKTNKQPNSKKQPTANKGPTTQPKANKGPGSNKGSRTAPVKRSASLETGGAGSQMITNVAVSLSQPYMNTGFPRLIGDNNRVPPGNLPATFQSRVNSSYNARYVFDQNCRMPNIPVNPYLNNYHAVNMGIIDHRAQKESMFPFINHGVNSKNSDFQCGRGHAETVNPYQIRKNSELNVSQRYVEQQTRMMTPNMNCVTNKRFGDVRHNETERSIETLYLNNGGYNSVSTIQNSERHNESVNKARNQNDSRDVILVEPESDLFQSDHEAIQALYRADKSKDFDQQPAQNSTEHLAKDRIQEPSLSNEVLYSRALDSYLNVNDSTPNSRNDALQLISPDIIPSSVGPLMSPVGTNSRHSGPLYTGDSAIRELSKMDQRITQSLSNSLATETSPLYRDLGGFQEPCATRVIDRDGSICYSLGQLNTAYDALQASFIWNQGQPIQRPTPIETFFPQMTDRLWNQGHRSLGERSQADCCGEKKTGGIDDQIVEKNAGKGQ